MEILGDITINVKQSDNILCKNIFASFHKNKKDLIIRKTHWMKSEGQRIGKFLGMWQEN